MFRISAYEVASNNIKNYFYGSILLSFPTKYQTQLKISSENI